MMQTESHFENKKTLCCLFGGKSTEYEISLMSVSSVLENVNRSHFHIITLGITREGKWLLYDGDIEKIRNNTWFHDDAHAHRCMLSPDYGSKTLLYTVNGKDWIEKSIDVIFPVMHGANAEDGTMQGLLTLSGIPFVGPGHCASALGMDKAYTKMVLQNYDIPQAKHCVVFRDEGEEALARAEAVSAYPLFVKPANAGSSVGASKAQNRQALALALETALAYDNKAIVEEYICAKEVECAVLGNGDPIASTPGEIDSGSEFYDYDAKYLTNTSRDFIPARIKAQTAQRIQEYACQIFRLLGCRGLSRVDFFVRETNGEEQIIFNEINTLPGFTKISMYPKLFVHDGMTYSALIDRLILLAMEA